MSYARLGALVPLQSSAIVNTIPGAASGKTIQSPDAAANDAAQKAAQAYQAALAALNPSWAKLLQAPYPPAGDATNFPRTGDPSHVVSRDQVNAAQLAEPGKVTRGLAAEARARRPELSPLFWVGAACLGGYFLLR